MQSTECQMKLTPGQIGELKRKEEEKGYFLDPRRLSGRDLLCNSMSEGGMRAVIDD